MGLLEREIIHFLKQRRVLVFDDKRSSRSEIKKGLIACGINPKNIILEKNFKKAKELILTNCPEIIISEFQVHDDYGLDLARMQMDQMGDQVKKIFIIVTSSATQAAVADAAEEEVDAFIIKPLNQISVADYLLKVTKRKINPSAYSTMIYESKRLIKEGNFSLAKQTLNMSKLMYDRPMMAFFYTGEIARLEGNMQQALEQYGHGLSFNDLHFKCLVGRFNCLIGLNRKKEAFECLGKITTHFPLTPDLLKSAFILSITSYHFEEVQTYYDQYLRQPRKTPDLKLTVSQALLTAGKILLRERKHTKIALDYFKKGAVISGKKNAFLSDAIDTMIREGYSHETENFFRLFNVDDINSELLELHRFKAFAKTHHKNPNETIEMGKKLIYGGHADQEAFFIICNLLKSQARSKLLENIVYKGIEVLPEAKTRFLSYL